IDLDAYFARIAYSGGCEPTLETLSALHVLHPQAIPFENLDPLMKRPVLIDAVAIQNKLIHARRGGYCYEHNGLLMRVLQQLGFRVTGLMARVLWFVPDNTMTPRSHMILRVELDGHDYVADVGFGGLTLTAPLRLADIGEQATPHEPFRLTGAGNGFFMQAKVRGEWRSLYRFDLAEQIRADYEIPNWYACTNPSSRFVNDLMVARTLPGKRYGLLNNELSTHTPAGTARCQLHSANELRTALEDLFGIAVPVDDALDAVLARLTKTDGAA
ncbi:MAG TPA: arylamine N-acetyltransferase, partial [Rhodocyclaceae bacterium]|nr:arylamine N-acetyltransferase [Rhodocyclaceae bacterium]